jgi:hypothetical protein
VSFQGTLPGNTLLIFSSLGPIKTTVILLCSLESTHLLAEVGTYSVLSSHYCGLFFPSPCVTSGFKDKSECKNTCAPGSSYTHASTQWIPKHSVQAYWEY